MVNTLDGLGAINDRRPVILIEMFRNLTKFLQADGESYVI